jgi:predicted metal-dependent HD superfamily phosphohydrolase
MNTIINKANEFLGQFFNQKLPKTYTYHNFNHTAEVVETAIKLGKLAGINESDLEILTLAALFHDTGHLKTSSGHEEVSAEICRNFLSENNYPDEKIEQITRLIIATKQRLKPEGILDEIIKDADIAHIGKKGFNSKSELLRIELLNITGKQFSDDEWIKMNIDFITKHDFFTVHAKNEYGDVRRENIAKLQKKMFKSKNKESKSKKEESEKKIPKTAMKNDYASLIRGVQTIFRTTTSNHIRLSEIADHKANIMIRVGALVISIVIRILFDYPKYNIPTLILIVVSLATIITATISTIPMITSGFISRDDVLNKKGNLLFFGNFHKMSLEEYSWSMRQLMDDKEYMYDTLIRDVYFLGKVLGKKYKYIRLSYNIFMYGMIVSVLAFLIAYFSK